MRMIDWWRKGKNGIFSVSIPGARVGGAPNSLTTIIWSSWVPHQLSLFV